MANNKTSFIYYSIDTNRYQDMKIKRLKKDFGCNGIAVYDYLLCEIYRVKGCFLEWGESTAFDVAEYFGLKESQVYEIVNYCGSVGLFNKELLTRERVITSLSIQNRFVEWSKKAKRANWDIPAKINLIETSEIIPEQSPKLQEESHHNSVRLPQSKVKESKEEESKGNTLPDGRSVELISSKDPVSLDAERKKEKDSGEKEKKFYTRFIDIYDSFLKSRGLASKMNAAEGQAANKLIQFLRNLNTDKSDDAVIRSWDFVFKKWDKLDFYHQKRLKLIQIESDIVNIIDQLKNGTAQKSTGVNTSKSINPTKNVNQGAGFGQL